MEDFDFDEDMAFARRASRRAAKLADVSDRAERELDDVHRVGRELISALHEVAHATSHNLHRRVDVLTAEPEETAECRLSSPSP